MDQNIASILGEFSFLVDSWFHLFRETVLNTEKKFFFIKKIFWRFQRRRVGENTRIKYSF